MYKLHIFESPEEHYDCVQGCDPLTTIEFFSEESAFNYLQEEYPNHYYSTPETLEVERKEYLKGCIWRLAP